MDDYIIISNSDRVRLRSIVLIYLGRGYVCLTWKCMAHTKNGMRSNILEMFVFSPKAAVWPSHCTRNPRCYSWIVISRRRKWQIWFIIVAVKAILEKGQCHKIESVLGLKKKSRHQRSSNRMASRTGPQSLRRLRRKLGSHGVVFNVYRWSSKLTQFFFAAFSSFLWPFGFYLVWKTASAGHGPYGRLLRIRNYEFI